MTHELESTFQELGIAQYLNTFVEQGFDTWETILDIQESDLDALGVKLGHRRKLQRRIANARGLGPSLSLSKHQSDDAKREGTRGSARSDSGVDANGTGVVKRKYRRHPKPDEHAPERPPSAYVLFSNKMREDLKGHNLTFTEIAKLVGENWQSLPTAEKEAYESQANAAKEKYHRDLAEYKKTPEYKKYALYLQDFKEKQAKQTQDTNKRTKVEPTRLRNGSTSSSAATGGTSASGSASLRDSRSGSEQKQGSEPPPNRHDRVGSVGGLSQMEGIQLSPRSATFDYQAPRPLRDSGRNGDGRQLPSLSDIMDDGRGTMMGSPTADSNPYTSSGFVPANARRPMPEASHAYPANRAPYLQREASSTDSSGSGGSIGSIGSGASAASSATSFGRPSVDNGTLPIHSLLTNRSMPPVAPHTQGASPTFVSAPSPIDHVKRSPVQSSGPQGYGFQSAPSALQHMKIEQANGGDVVMTSPTPSRAQAPKPKVGLDGMDALLRAGEIVGRGGHQ